MNPSRIGDGEDALVSRPHLDVEVRALPPGGAAFLLALAKGLPLGEAAEAALADDPGFDLAVNIAGLIGAGPRAGHRHSGAEELTAAMTNLSPAAMHSRSVPGRIVQPIIAALDRIPDWFIALAARVFPAAVFWQSGQTKVAGYHLKPSAIALFQNEYQLPLIDPATAAHVSALCRARFPDPARHWSRHPAFGAGPFVHDGGDRDIRLSGRLADPRRVGHLLSCRDRARPRLALARPFDRAQIPVELCLWPPTKSSKAR